VLINLAWTLYNLIITSAAAAVASETRQVRSEPRVRAALPVRVTLADGRQMLCRTQDFSQRGLGLQLPEGETLACGAPIRVSLFRNNRTSDFDATVVFSKGNLIGAQFAPLSLRQQSDLVRLTFSRADTWAESWGSSKPDTPLAALGKVSTIGLGGLLSLFKAVLALPRQQYAKKLSSKPLPDQP
jgi:cellulose synthase (UDP-forming)